MVSKRVTGFWGWRHLVHLWRAILFLDTKIIPNELQKMVQKKVTPPVANSRL